MLHIHAFGAACNACVAYLMKRNVQLTCTAGGDWNLGVACNACVAYVMKRNVQLTCTADGDWNLGMLFNTPHCKDTIPKIRDKYSQARNCADTVPIPTFTFL